MQAVNNATPNSALSPRIRELQKKIQDENYSAVDRIALIMSRHIVEFHIEKKL